MYGNNADGVELQALNVEVGEYSSLEAATARRAAWRRHSLLEPRFQKRFWIAVGVAVVIGAGVIFAATSTRQHGHNSGTPTPTTTSSRLQGSGIRGPFPAEPYLAPSNSCPLDTQGLGPEQQLAIPINYHLLLSLSDPALYQPGDTTGRVAAGFGGSVNITLHVEQDAPCVSLHAWNLSFSSISAQLIGASWLQPPQPQQQAGADVCLCGPDPTCIVQECGRLFKPRPGSDAFILSLGPYLAPAGSNLSLQFNYTASFGGKPQIGFLRSAAYPSAAGRGKEVVALATQFETIFARTVLPCLDEPKYKATFVVEVEAPSDLTVLSNSPAASTRWIMNNATSSVSRTTFQPTPVMSTYLLSIAVGELKAVKADTSSGQTVRVWTTPDTIAAAATPLRLAVAALEHYQNYTGILQSRGPDTKWDLLAVPGKSGAVENWRLLTMDPERFLFSSGGAWDLFRCANVICHEVAHQWYGNLVTADTWADLLVNEGLATLLEYGCMAAVLPQEVGSLGAAVLMRGMFGGPTGVNPGVHEGPYEKTLSYDASPLAEPLLGGGVDFGVPVYSKAAALMASVGSYAAAAGTQQHSAAGPMEGLMGSQPPGALQEVLRQHLQQHAFSTANAQDTLERILQLAPARMSDSADQVITGWQAPGSPLIELTTTPKGLKLEQRRFCSWGLLDYSVLTNLVAAAASTPAQALPTPEGANSSQSSSGALFCPTSLDGQDRAVPWTPLFLAKLSDPIPVNGSNVNTSTAASSNSLQRSLSCGQWVVLMRDEQTAALPNGCEAAASGPAADSTSTGPGFILEGDGGRGVYRTLYPAPQRAALRQWVVAAVRQAAREANSSGNAAAAATGLNVSCVLAASKILQDQAALALSAFEEVPGAEVWEILQAAVNATVAAGAALGNGAAGTAGFGTVLYTLLMPLLPAVEVLSDRAGSSACWMHQQERMAAALAPVATTALSTFSSSPASAAANASSPRSYASPDQFLGAMSLNRLLTATALVDAGTAGKLCTMFNKAVGAAGDITAEAAVVLSHIDPDLQHAVLDVVTAQPPGCQLDWSGTQLFSTFQQWYLDGREPRAATMAAFSLAHLPARGFYAPVPGQQVLALLMGLDTTQPAGSAAPQVSIQHTAASPASGISPAKHAAELTVLLSRAVTTSRRLPQPELAPGPQTSSTSSAYDSSSTPVVSELIRQWPLLVGGSLGEATAWEVLREVAAREVQEPQQWQQLAAWAVQQLPAIDNGQPVGVVQLQRKRVQALLGAAWSTVSWMQANRAAICQ